MTHPADRGRAIWAALCAVAALTAASPTATAEVLPADSGVLNVRDFGARGDGIADDTASIRRAVDAARVDQGRGFWPARMVYLPAGTYRVSDTLLARDGAGKFRASMALVGAGADVTRIVLADGTPGYGDADAPKAVIYTASGLAGGSPTDGGKDYERKGEGNDAYGNYVEDLTVDVGRRNPGAVAIDFLASNMGAVRHVRLIAPDGSGRTGLSMERQWPGPLLIADVRIGGFDVGIAVRHREYGVTMEDVVLRGQRRVALSNAGNMVSARRLSVDGHATALVNSAEDGLVVIDGLQLSGRSGQGGDWADNRGYLTVRDVVVASANGTRAAPAGALAADGAYFGTRRLAGYGANWSLPVRQPPAVSTPPLSKWANVQRFGARADDEHDATEGIQAAMNSGAEVVYFPSGRYRISDAIDVPASVRRIEGLYSSIRVLPRRAGGFSRETGMFRVAVGGEPLTIDRLAFDNMEQGPQTGIEHLADRTLVLRDVISGGVEHVHRRAGGGALFLENACCGGMRLEGPQGVWARQFNSEGGGVRVRNDGAPLWILGVKTEQNCTIVENLPGARTEILGGLLYIVMPPPASVPAFIVNPGSSLVAAYVESAYRDGAIYQEHVVSTDASGKRRVVGAAALPARGRSRLVPGLSVSSPAGDQR